MDISKMVISRVRSVRGVFPLLQRVGNICPFKIKSIGRE